MSSKGTNRLIPALCMAVRSASAQVPAILSYQGRFAVNGTDCSGNGPFRFALVSADGLQVFWGNAPLQGGQPNTNIFVATHEDD